MKSVCDKYGALFILDEVMSGMGRAFAPSSFCLAYAKNARSPGMGTLHAWESYGDGVSPDLQAIAKGLGGGYVASILPSLYPNIPKYVRPY